MDASRARRSRDPGRVPTDAGDRLVDEKRASVGGEGAELGRGGAGLGLMGVGGGFVRAVVDLPAVFGADWGVPLARGTGGDDIPEEVLVEGDGAHRFGRNVAQDGADHPHCSGRNRAAAGARERTSHA